MLELLFLSGKVEEWFEYEGEPYRFKVEVILDRELTAETVQKLYALINEYKNVRSWLDDLICIFLEKYKCNFQVANMSENFAEAFMRYAFELLASGHGLYQSSAIAEDSSEAEMVRKFEFVSRGNIYYQSSVIGEAIAYT